jgi:hypothetical protein
VPNTSARRAAAKARGAHACGPQGIGGAICGQRVADHSRCGSSRLGSLNATYASLGNIRGEQFRSQPSAPKRGIRYHHPLGNDVPADGLNSRFVHHASATHRVKIRRRLLSIIRDLGAGHVAATDHQFNPLIAHEPIVIMTRSGKRFQNAPRRLWRVSANAEVGIWIVTKPTFVATWQLLQAGLLRSSA